MARPYYVIAESETACEEWLFAFTYALQNWTSAVAANTVPADSTADGSKPQASDRTLVTVRDLFLFSVSYLFQKKS